MPKMKYWDGSAWLTFDAEDATTLQGKTPSDFASSAHTTDTTNPHSVTKAQVGLGNVLNYGIATTAQAQEGTSNMVYMTALRVKEAIAASGDGIIQQATPPTGIEEGRLWIDTSDDAFQGTALEGIKTDVQDAQILIWMGV